MDSVVMARGGERCWIHKEWFYAVGVCCYCRIKDMKLLCLN